MRNLNIKIQIKLEVGRFLWLFFNKIPVFQLNTVIFFSENFDKIFRILSHFTEIFFFIYFVKRARFQFFQPNAVNYDKICYFFFHDCDFFFFFFPTITSRYSQLFLTIVIDSFLSRFFAKICTFHSKLLMKYTFFARPQRILLFSSRFFDEIYVFMSFFCDINFLMQTTDEIAFLKYIHLFVEICNSLHD